MMRDRKAVALCNGKGFQTLHTASRGEFQIPISLNILSIILTVRVSGAFEQKWISELVPSLTAGISARLHGRQEHLA